MAVSLRYLSGRLRFPRLGIFILKFCFIFTVLLFSFFPQLAGHISALFDGKSSEREQANPGPKISDSSTVGFALMGTYS